MPPTAIRILAFHGIIYPCYTAPLQTCQVPLSNHSLSVNNHNGEQTHLGQLHSRYVALYRHVRAMRRSAPRLWPGMDEALQSR